MSRYPHLFSPLVIGGKTVRNRIVQTAHSKHFSRDGIDSQRDLHYHVARARGGAGLLITGNRFVHPSSSVAAVGFPRGYLGAAISSDRILTDAVHGHGALIVAQLNHGGINGSSDAPDDLRLLMAPSQQRSPYFGEAAAELDRATIREITEWWAEAAGNAQEGGFDGVEIHMAHSYLLHQFLSPLYNRRDDDYGGSLTSRLRFPLEVVDEVRRQVGKAFIVGARISLSDFLPGGLEIGDAIQIASALRNTGQLDYLNVTAGTYHGGMSESMAPADLPDGWLVGLGAELKAAVSGIPIFAVGGIRFPSEAEAILAEGKADMVAMTRALIADPELPNKAREGREERIYHCIRANQGCISRTWRGLPMACTVNPAVGREELFGQEPARAERPGRWIVVGGGPAGMKAAETLARRGHRVTLYEREDRLGGQINLIVRNPYREHFASIPRDLESQLRQLDIELRLATEATPDGLRAETCDGIILATGALPDRTGHSPVAPFIDRLPGVDRDNVCTVWDVLRETAQPGPAVVVLDDEGTRYGAGVAELLLDRGHRVEVVTRWSSLFPDTAFTLAMGPLYRRLFAKGLKYRINTWARSIGERSVTVYDLYSGKESTIEAVDAVVLATGAVSDDALFQQIRESVPNLHRIGDCLAPRRVDHAIYEGYVAGQELFGPRVRYILEDELDKEPAGTQRVRL